MRLVLILFLSLFSLLYSKPSDKVLFQENEITELEAEFFNIIDNGNITIETYYDAFLIASGIVDYEEFNEYKSKLNDLRARAQEELAPYALEGPEVLGEELLLWLYSDNGILKKYVLKATLAQDLFNRGQYNCLSSSIIYALIFMEFGFEVKGVLTKHHSFCTIVTPSGDIDVETTLSVGFNPGTKEIEEMANSQRITYVPKGNYRDREDVTIMTLIASLYANSISLLGRSINDPYEGLAMYKKGYYLAPDFDFFQKNILSSMNNIAIQNVKKANYEEAMYYFDQAEAFSPKNTITHKNRIYYYNTIGTLYLNKKDYPSAIQAFKEGVIAIGTNSGVLKRNLKVAYYNYAVNEYNAKRYNNASFISNEALVLFPNDRDFVKLRKSIPK